MSIPTSVEAIVVIVLIFIPGYVFLQFTRSAVAFIPQAIDARYFFALVTWGGLIHALALRWSLRVLDWYQEHTLEDHATYVTVWAALTLVLVPVLLGAGGAWLITQPRVDSLLSFVAFDYVSRTPSAWNYSTKLGPRWVRVHLRDGTIIGGLYGDTSFADDAEEKDIFLERVYNLDEFGDFDTDEVVNSAGVWISRDTVSHVMFFTQLPKEVSDDE